MQATDERVAFASIDPAERILLLPHCLRPSDGCRGKHTRSGMQCPDDCDLSCAIRSLREAAVEAGYKGVCIAPGGRLALRYVEENRPRGIVAVACDKELAAGVNGVREVSAKGIPLPSMVVIPLARDGCVDCEVDEDEAIRTIRLGCHDCTVGQRRRAS
ncbi:MAG: DUF116 domain-containing protein [Acidobacteria bacterium]|nr:DUF116 domain-containing protein [Acidobacteriota bacterium]